MLKPFLTETPVAIFKQLGIKDEKLQEWDSLYEMVIFQKERKRKKGNPYSLD